MAIFNPQVQDINTPDWTKTSHPISQPEADKSKGIMLSTVGNALEGGVKIAEDTMQDYLKEKVSAGVDALRDTSILAYQDIRSSQITGQPPDPAAVKTAGFKGTLVKEANSDVPDDLQSGLDRAQNIALAKAQRGSANDTLYTANLYALTKQLRAEYPGHRDFIDQQIAKISGKNPANAFMDNLLADINRSSTGQDVFQKMVMTKAAANMGDAEVQKWLIAAQQNVPNSMSGLTQAVFKAEKQKAQHEQWRIQNEESKGDQSADATKATGQAEVRAQQIVDKHLNPVLEIPGLTAPQTMKKLVEDSMTGKITLQGAQKDMLVQSLAAARSQAADDLQRTLDKEGYSQRIRDPKALQAIRDDKLGYLDRAIALITDDKWGSMGEARRRVTAMQDETNLQAQTSPTGEWLRKSKVIGDHLGPQWLNYIDSLGLAKGNLQQLQSFMNDTMVRASTPDDVRKDGVVKSMYSDLQTARNAKANGVKAPDKIYDNIVENVGLINSATEQGKQDVAKEVVKYTFDPSRNSKIMEFFGKDFTDDSGKFHKGRMAVYDTLTQPKLVDNIWNLRDKDAWKMHKDWQEMSFKTIFGESVKDLDKKINWNLSGMKDTKLVWDSDNNRFSLAGPTVDKSSKIDRNVPPQALPADVANVRITEATINQLNSGLQNLSYMRKKEGEDVNSYLFDMLMGLGYSPNDKLRGDNLPQKAIEAVAASSKSNKMRIEDAFRASKGSAE